MVKVNRNLPIELESNILSRLPVKSLVRFKSVQKSWYSLISDPFFINLHLHHHHSQNNNDYLLLMKSYCYNLGKDKIFVADTCLNVLSTFKDFYPSPMCYDYVYNVVGSSNGLVCIRGLSRVSSPSSYSNNYVMEYIGLWNPALRINKMIRCRRMRKSRSAVNVGFGFHNQSNDYKVIRFKDGSKAVKIYSLSSDSWRKVECACSDLWRNCFLGDGIGVYVNNAPLIRNGAYCWLAGTFESEPDDERIILFDMGDEVFKDTRLPPISDIFDASLFNYRDSLAVLETHFASNMSYSFCYVWVMKEYNDPKSWTKICIFDTQCHYVSAGYVEIILETELVLTADKSGSYKDEVYGFDIAKSQTNIIFPKNICLHLEEASYFSSFKESLVLLTNRRKRPRSD